MMAHESLKDSIHYWLGQVSMADEMIADLEKLRSRLARRRLHEAKQLRAEAMKEVERCARRG